MPGQLKCHPPRSIGPRSTRPGPGALTSPASSYTEGCMELRAGRRKLCLLPRLCCYVCRYPAAPPPRRLWHSCDDHASVKLNFEAACACMHSHNMATCMHAEFLYASRNHLGSVERQGRHLPFMAWCKESSCVCTRMHLAMAILTHVWL